MSTLGIRNRWRVATDRMAIDGISRYAWGVPTKTYGQMCPLARSLDVLGERWTMLVIRELLLGPKRFKHLLAVLPAIGSNRLSERLRGLEEAGIIRKSTLPPPAAVAVYELTEEGERLRDLPGLILPVEPEWADENGYNFVCHADPQAVGYNGPANFFREAIVRALTAEGVPASVWQRRILPELAAVQSRTDPAPGGFESARRVRTSSRTPPALSASPVSPISGARTSSAHGTTRASIRGRRSRSRSTRCCARSTRRWWARARRAA